MVKKKKNKDQNIQNKSGFENFVEYFQALLGAIVLAILIRGFLVEPFKIPSESMLPTLLVGDHIFVARYQYGLRIPFTKKWIAEFEDPERGDVVVFTYPEDESVDFIKRVVGVPGDVLRIKNGRLFVNGKEATYQPFSPQNQDAENACVMAYDKTMQDLLGDDFPKFPHYLKYKKFQQLLETFPDGNRHIIQEAIAHLDEETGEYEVIVPDRNYFVMGDNRDYSKDSRFWGFVPRENLKGKAQFVWLSLNHEKTECAYNIIDPEVFPNVRWDRFGNKIK